MLTSKASGVICSIRFRIKITFFNVGGTYIARVGPTEEICIFSLPLSVVANYIPYRNPPWLSYSTYNSKHKKNIYGGNQRILGPYCRQTPAFSIWFADSHMAARQDPQDCCDIGYPSETNHKLQKHEISFVQSTHFSYKIVSNICIEYGNYTSELCANKLTTEQLGMGTKIWHEIWVKGAFPTCILHCNTPLM